jgi:hypothetical protein
MGSLNFRRFNSPGDGAKELQEGFNAWCSILTKHSIEATLAIIAANWAVYGNTEVILDNIWSKWSLIVAVTFLGLNLVGTGWMTFLYNKHRRYADENKIRWKNLYEEADNKTTPWPYTHLIQAVGSISRFLKVIMPFMATTFFIVSLF